MPVYVNQRKAKERKKKLQEKHFKFRPGYRGKIDPQIAGEELERIRKRDGCVKTKIVVDEARPEKAPLHPEFEWNDSQAAELYRENQAMRLIRSIRIVKADDTKNKIESRLEFLARMYDQRKNAVPDEESGEDKE